MCLYLFILCVEIFAIRIRTANNIKGVCIQNKELRITQFADDTTLFLDGSEDTFRNVIAILKKFEFCSGLKANLSKSHLFPLGSCVNNISYFIDDLDFQVNYGPIRFLGIFITNRKEDFFALNYLPKLSRLKSILSIWSQRDLTPFGKITIIKTLGLSQLVYIASVLPNPPRSFFKDLGKLLYNFIWGGKPDKIKRNVLINRLDNGGLNMIHLESFFYALKIAWVKRYLQGVNADWKLFFDLQLKSKGQAFFFSCNFNPQDLNFKNQFINDVCFAWTKLTFHRHTLCYYNELLWNNAMLRIDNKPVFMSEMYSRNCVRVGDLLDENGLFLNYDTFCSNFNVYSIPFTTYFGLLHAIPKDWIRSYPNLQLESKTSEEVLVSNLLACEKATKFAYNFFIDNIVETPIAHHKWEMDSPSSFDWNSIYRCCRLSVLDTKIKFFQYNSFIAL